MSLEIIVTGARNFAWSKPEFWDAYRKTPAWEFARFAALAAKGTPQTPQPPLSKDQMAAREREDFEASMRWTRDFMGKA
jgi:hypothetical protein